MEIDRKELEYLERVENYISSQLEGFDDNMLSLKEYIREERQRMWEDFVRVSDRPDTFELVQISQTESRDTQRFERMEKENAALKILAKSPYFARLDFKEDGFDAETIYIGRRSLSEENSSEMLVCDWRSDIAGMFYDSPLGKTSYQSVMGKIPCELLLRRQYKIADGKMLYMFDSDVAIEDDILQQELSKTSDEKLKTIIATIQSEQNAVIRNLDSSLLLVSGVAGSGKTSIALHRLAYILYKYRKTLTSSNIIIFSPNNVFNAYIADVLPDLGEDKVLQTSFYEFFSAFFAGKTVLPLSEQAERVFANETSRDEILAKGSLELAKKLREYFEKTAIKDIETADLSIAKSEVRTKKELDYLYFDLYKSYMPSVRIQKIKEGLAEYCENELRLANRQHYEKAATEDGVIGYNDDDLNLECESRWQCDLDILMHQIEQMLRPNIEKAYLAVLKDFLPSSYEATKSRLENGIINYEDMLPLAYLKMLCGDIREQRRIKHIVVDEAQDYPPILYLMTAEIFKQAKQTVLGDPDQAFISHLSSIKDISACYNVQKQLYVELNKTYRSTVEINEFLQEIAGKQSDTAFYKRHGDAVKTVAHDAFAKTVEELAVNFPTTAVICKTEADARAAYESLCNSGVKVKLIGAENMVFPGETVVLPSYLTKGLEFDAVVVFDTERKNPDDDRVFYVCASRALHKLVIVKG